MSTEAWTVDKLKVHVEKELSRLAGKPWSPYCSIQLLIDELGAKLGAAALPFASSEVERFFIHWNYQELVPDVDGDFVRWDTVSPHLARMQAERAALHSDLTAQCKAADNVLEQLYAIKKERDALQSELTNQAHQVKELRALVDLFRDPDGTHYTDELKARVNAALFSDQIAPQPAPVGQAQARVIQLAAVAIMRDDGDGGLRPEWLLEGGTAELFEGDTLLVSDDKDLCAEDGSAEVYRHPEKITVVGRNVELPRCEIHGDRVDDCETYSGKIPCEPESAETAAIESAYFVVADSGGAALFNGNTLEQLKELSKAVEFVNGINISGPATKTIAFLTCAAAVPELVARIEQLERENG